MIYNPFINTKKKEKVSIVNLYENEKMERMRKK